MTVQPRTDPAQAPPRPASAAEVFRQAGALLRQGRLEDAARLYRIVLQVAPDHAQSLHCLGFVHIKWGRFADAAVLLQRAVAADPQSAQAHGDFGIALQGLERLPDAVASYNRAVALAPDFVEARNNLGNALHALGRDDEAVEQFRAALELRPQAGEIANNLGIALAALGRHGEAVAHYERALALTPGFAEAHNNLGIALAALGRLDEAVAHYREAVARKPRHAPAYNNLGLALAALGRHEEAAAEFGQAVALDRGSAEAHNNLANALAALDRHTEALAHYRAAVLLTPNVAALHCNLGDGLIALGHIEEAVGAYGRAVALDPDLAVAHANRGNALAALGALAEARQSLERATTLAPRRVSAHRMLAELKEYRPGDRHLAAMEALLAEPAAGLSEGERAELHFALGKAYADCAEHRAAFAHWESGNALFRRSVVYDEAERLAAFDRVAALFSRDFIASRRGVGDPSPKPIFVIGLPRSGTTLVEQILASHPDVFGAGEIGDFLQAVEAVARAKPGWTGFPDDLATMTGDELRAIGERYVTALTALAPAAAHVTDKMPGNFFAIGLIHLVLPQARIVRLRRDPVDTCLSAWSRLFPVTLPYCYDLGELGRYHRAYDRLMAHWSAVLPEGAMLDVEYEALVADFEPQVRRILAHCGLDWNEACARYYETRRPVRTASLVQVRQPIYRNSVARWRPYRDMLRPLLDALGVE